jgi:hypothetical protein
VSFHELWRAWNGSDVPAKVRATAVELARRYAVALPDGDGR